MANIAVPGTLDTKARIIRKIHLKIHSLNR